MGEANGDQAGQSWQPVAFKLIGKEKVPMLGRFPSDHWGMLTTWSSGPNEVIQTKTTESIPVIPSTQPKPETVTVSGTGKAEAQSATMRTQWPKGNSQDSETIVLDD